MMFPLALWPPGGSALGIWRFGLGVVVLTKVPRKVPEQTKVPGNKRFPDKEKHELVIIELLIH